MVVLPAETRAAHEIALPLNGLSVTDLGYLFWIGEHRSLFDPVANRPYRNDGIYDQNWKEAVGVFIGKPAGENIE